MPLDQLASSGLTWAETQRDDGRDGEEDDHDDDRHQHDGADGAAAARHASRDSVDAAESASSLRLRHDDHDDLDDDDAATQTLHADVLDDGIFHRNVRHHAVSPRFGRRCG